MDESTDKLIKALGYFSADDVKKLQTKLAKAANSIVNDGLSYKLEPFYSEEEKATLLAAAEILRNIKNRVEHVKEIKARKEKAERAKCDEFNRQRHALLDKEFPAPHKNRERYRPILIWHLAVSRYLRASPSFYMQRVRHVKEDMQRWSMKEDPMRWTETVDNSVMHWRDQLIDDLKHSGFRDDEPVETSWNRISEQFDHVWKQAIQADHADLIDILEKEVAALGAANVTKIRPISTPKSPRN